MDKDVEEELREAFNDAYSYELERVYEQESFKGSPVGDLLLEIIAKKKSEYETPRGIVYIEKRLIELEHKRKAEQKRKELLQQQQQQRYIK